jgi:hypothetical protein
MTDLQPLLDRSRYTDEEWEYASSGRCDWETATYPRLERCGSRPNRGRSTGTAPSTMSRHASRLGTGAETMTAAPPIAARRRSIVHGFNILCCRPSSPGTYVGKHSRYAQASSMATAQTGPVRLW